jgi:hypothetical protein
MEPKFTADPHTPSVNGLAAALCSHDPNGNYQEYPAEQEAYHGRLTFLTKASDGLL